MSRQEYEAAVRAAQEEYGAALEAAEKDFESDAQYYNDNPHLRYKGMWRNLRERYDARRRCAKEERDAQVAAARKAYGLSGKAPDEAETQ